MIAGYEAAASVHSAHIQFLKRVNADAVALDREFQSGKGPIRRLTIICTMVLAGCGRERPSVAPILPNMLQPCVG